MFTARKECIEAHWLYIPITEPKDNLMNKKNNYLKENLFPLKVTNNILFRFIRNFKNEKLEKLSTFVINILNVISKIIGIKKSNKLI